ncbi:MAG: vitamin B12-dependent ribonucleotide reductase [Candidatus Thermoplasmatota archaeon]|jgi:ribonucleoside-diphosphate reductase alpha chain|nr:vitamin B12-dependent ribonucleotide reductase [Candidatus Thermoplasmatota archaeon]
MDIAPMEDPKLSDNAMTVLKRRYFRKDDNGNVIETPMELFLRVASNIAKADLNYSPDVDIQGTIREFYDIMSGLEFVPNSPTLMNAGRELQQLSACFVLPIEDSLPGIFETVKHTAMIHKSGGGTGFSFSRIRPKNDLVRSTKGVSSGPISFMQVFDAATDVIKQGGTRRGANMAILRVDHPDIKDFISAKDDSKKLNNFNLSVSVTDRFMEALVSGGEYDLINPRNGQSAGKESAPKIFDLIIKQAHKNGEPGIVFIDRINRDNPTPKMGVIESTNPCGEQPLLPYESCNLGSINLSLMVNEDRTVDWERVRRVVRTSVHFLDNVIDMNNFPLKEIEANTKANRKIGLGVMGWADMLFLLGIPYDSEEAVELATRLMGYIKHEADQMSRELARKRGPFPNFTSSIFAQRGEEPMRNATTTTIAPTGTISIIAGASSGIEPLFALVFKRNVMDRDRLMEVHTLFSEVARKEGFYSNELMDKIAEKGSIRGISGVPEKHQRVFVSAHDITPEWHIRMQAAFQRFTDNAVSKTVNFSHDATMDDVRKVYLLAYELGCKGVTIYRDGSREEQVLSTIKKKKTGMDTGMIRPRERPKLIHGITGRVDTGCGALYVTINADRFGPFEMFANLGKGGGCAAAQIEAIARQASLSLRSGIDPWQIVKQLKGIRCPNPKNAPLGMAEESVLSCPDGMAKALERYLQGKSPSIEEERTTAPTLEYYSDGNNIDQNGKVPEEGVIVGVCPECGNSLVYQDGCSVCHSCYYSKCS